MRTRYPYSEPLQLFLCPRMKPCARLTPSWARAQRPPLQHHCCCWEQRDKRFAAENDHSPPDVFCPVNESSSECSLVIEIQVLRWGGPAGIPGEPHLTRVYALTAASVDTKVHSFIVQEGTVAEPGRLLWPPPLMFGENAPAVLQHQAQIYQWFPGTVVQLNRPVKL